MNIGVIGTGKMGAAIFKLLSSKPYNITVLAIDEEEAEKNEKKYLRGLKRSLKNGKLAGDEFSRKKESLRFTHRVEDLASSDIVIEAIFEDYDEKASIFCKLESVVNRDAVLVSNTSSISIKDLARELKHKDRFCGLHFFHPVFLLELVEIIRWSDTPDELVGFLKNFCERIDKRAIVVDDAPGSVINAILAYYYLEALYILEEGQALPSKIDEVAKRSFYVGPCESIDVIGIDFFIRALERAAAPEGLSLLSCTKDSQAEIQKEEIDERKGFYIPFLLRRLFSENRLGKKVSKGIYIYQKDRPLDDTFEFYMGTENLSSLVHIEEADKLIEKRLLYSILNGSAHTAQRGMSSPEELDFAVREALLMKDGPFTMMKAIGEKKLKEDFIFLSQHVGKRFKQPGFDFFLDRF